MAQLQIAAKMILAQYIPGNATLSASLIAQHIVPTQTNGVAKADVPESPLMIGDFQRPSGCAAFSP